MGDQGWEGCCCPQDCHVLRCQGSHQGSWKWPYFHLGQPQDVIHLAAHCTTLQCLSCQPLWNIHSIFCTLSYTKVIPKASSSVVLFTSPSLSSSSTSSANSQGKGNRPKCDFWSDLGHIEAKCFLKEKLMSQIASPSSSTASPVSTISQATSQSTPSTPWQSANVATASALSSVIQPQSHWHLSSYDLQSQLDASYDALSHPNSPCWWICAVFWGNWICEVYPWG